MSASIEDEEEEDEEGEGEEKEGQREGKAFKRKVWKGPLKVLSESLSAV